LTTLILRNEEVCRLIEADWFAEDGPIRLETSLPQSAFEDALLLHNTRLVMSRIHEEGGTRLTARGNLNRKFVSAMAQAMRWRGLQGEVARSYGKALNEGQFMPLHLVRVLLDLSRLARKHKGAYRLTRRGKSLLAPEASGDLMAVLFDTVFRHYNLAYIDAHPAEDDFASQIALTLFVMQHVAETPRTPQELMEAATHPMSRPTTEHSFSAPATVFRLRVLRYLDWFGLVENLRPTAGWKGETTLWRKTPLYDRFLSFQVDAEWR